MTMNPNKKRMRRVILALAPVLIAFLSACGGGPKMLAAPPATPAMGKTGYRIAPGDHLVIKLYYHPELNAEVWVRPDGFISLELAGEVSVAGQTPAQVDSVLEMKYGRKLVNPEVAVIVKNSVTLKVFVGGEVQQPGLVAIDGGMTLLGAIFQAGGFKSSAQLSQIVLLRKAEASSQPLTSTLDVRGALQGKQAQANVALQPFDVIYVPKSGVARANQFMDEFVEGLLPVSTLTGFAWVYSFIK
jgi:protein involved in polysaccharide export with SLBB domain